MLGDIVLYTDLLIRIGPPRPNSAVPAVEALIDQDSLFYGGALNLDETQLLAAENDNAAYGGILRTALFSEPIQRAYERASQKAKEKTGGRLRIRLQIDNEVARYQQFRWERTSQLFDGQSAPLSTSTRTPFSRFAGLEGESAAPLSVKRIRMAVCISNPKKLPPELAEVQVEDEVRNLRKTIGNLRQTFQQLDVSISPGRTGLPKDLLDGLAAEGYTVIPGPLTRDVLVERFRTANVVHFLGHGVFKPDTETAALFLEKADTGELDLMRDDQLLPLVRGASQVPHLVVLMSCEGARRGAGVQPFVGLAGKLVEAGIPALLAMQIKVPMEDAAELTSRFYASLLATGIVDCAANEARSYLYDFRKSDFSIPALFMRLKNGQLLAPDPALTAMKAIVADTLNATGQKPLPIDVVHVTTRITQAMIEQLAKTGEPAIELMNATQDVFLDQGAPKPNFVLLFGAQGTAKSTFLKLLAYTTALDYDRRIIPVYLNLVEYFKTSSTLSGRAEQFLTDSLAPYWPGLAPEHLIELLLSESGPRFRFLVDGSDELSERQRAEVLGMLADVALKYRSNQCLYASDICYADEVPSAVLDIVADVLVIKSISQNRAEKYLASLQDPAADKLNSKLQDKKLFDLASPPWLLVRMLQQARRGTFPESRASVLKLVVDDLLAKVTAQSGIRARAADVLYALAWAMHSQKTGVLTLTDAFPIIDAVRGHRGFGVEELFEQLVEQNLLARVGHDRLRFAYAAIQDYCCAKALEAMSESARAAALDDITAKLGRLTVLRWWDEALIILSGLLPAAGANSLIESVLYGSGFGEGERIFLGARCIQECGTDKVKAQIVGQVEDGLVWRSKIVNEPRQTLRIRAIETLAGMQATNAIPHLTALAVEQVRKNFMNRDAFEYPAIRLAAALALMRMDKPATESKDKPPAEANYKPSDTPACDYLWRVRPDFARTMDLWRAGDVEQLGAVLAADSPAMDLAPSIAAFALGQIRTQRAAKLLVAGFNNTALPIDTRWCIADSLKLLDPVYINEQVLIPFWAEVAQRAPDISNEVDYRYDQVAYLAGKIKSSEPATMDFLKKCLTQWVRVSLKGRAMQSIASIRGSSGKDVQEIKTLFEQVASGDFSGLLLPERMDAGDPEYLQVSALESLCEMGDNESVEFLRAHRRNWAAEVERQFFLTSEEIYWRTANTPAQGL